MNNRRINLRHGKATTNTTLSVKLIEYLEWTISQGSESLAAGILLVALDRELYDVGAAHETSMLQKMW